MLKTEKRPALKAAAGLALLMAAVTPLAAAKNTDPNWTIVPGSSLGKIRIGQDGESLADTMPNPSTSDCAMGKCWLTWFSPTSAKAKRQRVDVYQTRNFGHDNDRARVQEIRATSPSFSTAGGTSTANSWSNIYRYYPNLKRVASYPGGPNGRIDIYDDVQQGIAFEVTAKTSKLAPRCVAIIVHRKGDSVGQEYLGLHNSLKLVNQAAPVQSAPENGHGY